MHKLDVALARSFPVASVPKYGPFEPLAEPGQRLLVASNGLFLEIERNWLHAIVMCGIGVDTLRLPFGNLEQRIELRFGKVPTAFIAEFIHHARAVAPNELAGVMAYDRATDRLDLRL